MRLRKRLIVAALVLLGSTLTGCERAADVSSPTPESEAATATRDATSAFLPPATAAKARPDPQQDLVIDWLDLMPDAERKALEAGEWPEIDIEHETLDGTGQFGSSATVASMHGRKVRVPGYIVPIDLDDQQRMRSFFLVPYFGACIHVPPPPPNQLIYAELDAPIEVPSMWDAYWLTAELQIARVDADIASSSYRAVSAQLEPWTD
jgi:hypothetical protein